MAEAVVSAVVDQLISAGADWLKEEISLLKDVESKRANMVYKMKVIQTVLADAENQSVKKEIVKLWVKELEDVSYDMDDVLDEWTTTVHMLEREMANFTCFSLKKLTIFSSVKQLPWRHDIALRIKYINERIDLVFSEMKDFNFASNAVGNDDVMNKIIYRTTTSTIDQPKVFGRDDNMKFLLTRVNTEHQESQQVISIVGTGGLGKTTLAQMVYKDGEVEKKFGERRIWVCVSNPFDEFKVARHILEGLKVNHNKMSSLQTLHQSIEKNLSEDKFLLILDDVWNENWNELENLRKCLQLRHPASTILVTTRHEEVASKMGTTQSNILNPDLISDQNCWFLMRQIAFQGRTNKVDEEFEDVGKKIAKRCKGLPLAAKMLGSTLISKDSVDEWKDILNSKLWELEKAKVDLFPHIFLSYQQLSAMLKHCFLILTIFPKDTELEVEEVIRIWMAQGFLNQRTKKDDMVNTGQKYLKFLVSRAFLKEKYTKILMHDIIHDFGLYLLGDVISISQLDKIENDSGSMSTSKRGLSRELTMTRHLYIDGDIDPTSICSVEKVRTCIMQCVRPNVISDLVKGLKMVRALYLLRCDLKEVPESIGKLIHLRLLDLSENRRLFELPETIGGLYNLQTLILEECGVPTLPDSIGKLSNLIFLKLEIWELEKFPESVGKLINLQYMDGIVKVGGGKSKLRILKDLNQLRGKLEIQFCSWYDDEVDVKKAAIQNKKHITEMVLSFNNQEVTGGVIAALQPPSNLQELEITELCSCVSLPGWITSLHHLTDLNVNGAPNITTLPTLGKLQSLEKLSLCRFAALKIIGRKFWVDNNDKGSDAFPKLLKLEILYCDFLEEWEDITEEDEGQVTVMPKLQRVEIRGCRSLKGLPSQLLCRTSMKELRCESISESLAEYIKNDKQLMGKGKTVISNDQSLGPNLRLRRR